MTVDIKKATFPQEVFKSLSAEERYVFVMVAHIQNELMAIQKVLGISLPKDEHTDEFLRNPMFSQAMIWLRIAVAKIYEAHSCLNNPPMGKVIKEKYLPLIENGAAR